MRLNLDNWPFVHIEGAIQIDGGSAHLTLDLSELPRSSRAQAVLYVMRHFPVEVVTRYGDAVPRGEPEGYARARRQVWWVAEFVKRLVGR